VDFDFVAISKASAPVSKRADIICIYDGNSTDAPLIINLNGSFTAPLPSYVSSQQYMLVRFVSDNTFVYQGFNMTYTTIVQGEAQRIVSMKQWF
jgi:CUB domain